MDDHLQATLATRVKLLEDNLRVAWIAIAVGACCIAVLFGFVAALIP